MPVCSAIFMIGEFASTGLVTNPARRLCPLNSFGSRPEADTLWTLVRRTKKRCGPAIPPPAGPEAAAAPRAGAAAQLAPVSRLSGCDRQQVGPVGQRRRDGHADLHLRAEALEQELR